MYKVESCVCDYAIYNDDTIISELIFNSRKNAEKVGEIMNLDAEHKVVDDTDKKCSCNSMKSTNSGMKCSNCGREL